MVLKRLYNRLNKHAGICIQSQTLGTCINATMLYYIQIYRPAVVPHSSGEFLTDHNILGPQLRVVQVGFGACNFD